MFKFRAILWALGLLLRKSARKNPDFRKQLAGKDFVYQLQTENSKIVRDSKVANDKVVSNGRAHKEPAFTISFKDAQTGLRSVTSKDKNAFMKGIQEKDIVISGDLSLLMWFQGITKHLKSSKKKKR